MKKYFLMSLVIMMSSLAIAQKKELKEAEKAIKDSNFASAKTALSSAETMMSAMDDKSKAKFYYLKAQAFYANGSAGDAEIKESLNSIKMLKETETASGKLTYTTQANDLMVSMSNGFIEKAQNAFQSKNHMVASNNFEYAYRTSSQDTLFLYNAALLATSSKDYDRALVLYSELTDLGYTGITEEYLATNKDTGEEESFPSQAMRDISVKAGTHEKSRNNKTDSKIGEIAKNVALIYIEKGENDKALEAIDNAKKTNPNDLNLLLSEANVRYKLGDTEEYKKLISKAIELDPNNADLLFNLGVVASETNFDEAKMYYEKALAIDPNYSRANMNLAALILDKEQVLIDEMNGLGTSSADNKRYDELQEERTQLYKEAVPYLENALKTEPDNINAAKTLMNIYSILGEDTKFREMQAKVAEMEGGK